MNVYKKALPYYLSISLIVLFRTSLLAQTQYDYYESSPYDRSDVIDGPTLLGLIVIGVICFIIWYVNQSIKLSKKKKETERIYSNITTPTRKTPKQLREEKLKKQKEWEKPIEEILKEEFKVIFIKEFFGKDVMMEGRLFSVKEPYENSVMAHIIEKGYVAGCFRRYSFMPLDMLRNIQNSPFWMFGYLRGMQEQSVEERFGKAPE